MSNCDFVAGRSLIALVASRLALRVPALRAASTLTPPNQSAQWLPSGRHGVPTVKVVGPNDVITNHGIEHGDHAHDRDDHDFRHLACALEAHSHLPTPSLLIRARAQATVRVWKKRPELQAHSRFTIQDGCGLPVATGAVS
jgi:hypothetical protein